MIPSPCRKTCRYDDQAGFCRDCGRTLAEIQEWRKATSARKTEICYTAERRRLSSEVQDTENH